jgi:putative spermidine/putrescine transport system ATP-binding protein
MQIELKELHRRLGVTFVYVTHDQSEALTMSDRVAVFNEGDIQQIDHVTQLYETPSNRFVAGFVGDSTVLDGKAFACDASGCELGLSTGERLAGVNVNGIRPGAPVRASIRPERIEAHFDPPADASNVVGASLDDVIYFGDHLRLRCAIAGQELATVKVPLASGFNPNEGQPLWLRFPTHFLRVYA